MNPINPLTGTATVDKKGGISVESAWQLWAELWAHQSPQPLGEYKDQPDGFRVAWFDFLSNITYRLRETACDYRVVNLQNELAHKDAKIKQLAADLNRMECKLEQFLDRDDDYNDPPAPRRRKPAKKAAKKRAPAKRKSKKGTK